MAIVLAASALACGAPAAWSEQASPRKIISLDGAWDVAEGGMDDSPARFDRKAPVPGLADMATPRFEDVGAANWRRQAFWYRRTFTLPSGIPEPEAGGPAVAMLKVNKAQFGTKVWLNGDPVGEHLGCCTPGFFDVAGALRFGKENTLLIRVGAARESLPNWVPTNTDYEQVKWIPGIYDSVSLTLTGGPHIANLQVAPRIADGTALVQVALRNVTSGPVNASIRLTVREWRSGRAAASPVAISAALTANGERTVTARMRLKAPRLWSPEQPFLYVVRCESGGDATETRFGMREFRYDVKTGRAILNGKPYFLRGTNFCMFRFFEDPLRGGLPWDHAWARRLLTLPRKELAWNAARVCIGPFPEFWYDLADELGWLLQDEFPIWGFKDEWSQEELQREFREWLQERWNHPSIVVWDACNETKTPRTGQAIASVRPLDLSVRPWDDGYCDPNRPGDAVEDHPYRFSDAAFRLENLGSATIGPGAPALRKKPVMINEYDWLWIDRQGGATKLTEKLYDTALGKNATPEARREFCAYNNAALTEYWRARREAAGVLHFCYLTYSRPGGQTSDNFVDIRALTMEPRFLAYMRDAFNPLGVMIDDFRERVTPGKREYRIIVTNDVPDAQSGSVRLRLLDAKSATVWQGAPQSFQVTPLGQTSLRLPAAIPSSPGKYRIEAVMTPSTVHRPPSTVRPVCSRRDLQVLTRAEARRDKNLAEGRPVTASSEIRDTRGDCRARFAVDGNPGTRWSSQFGDDQWISVDLGAEQKVARVALQWEAAFGKAYRIQVSTDGKEWKTVSETTEGHGGREEARFEPVSARYVRLCGVARGTPYGYSLWEFQVFGP